MNNKNIKILLVTSLLILVGCQSGVSTDEATDTKEVMESVSVIEKNVEGTSMEPLIKNGSTVLLSSGFYESDENEAQIGDIVSYDFKGEEHPIIKTVVARDSDMVELKNNTLFVNDKEVLNSAGESYNFSDPEQRVMRLYIKESKIPKNSVFILGDNVEESRDSRKFGAVSMDDMFGKISVKD